MAQYNGSSGWILIGAEAVAYGTEAATLVCQHAISSSLKGVETRIYAPQLGSIAATTGRRILSHAAGNVVLGHSDEEDDVAVIYNHMASLAVHTWTFGGTPTVTSHTVCNYYGGTEYEYKGAFANSITWNLVNNGISTTTLDYIARYPVVGIGAARNPTIPPETEIVIPGDLATFTVDGDPVVGLTTANINFAWPATGMEHISLGNAVLTQPIRSDRPTIKATLTLEMDTAGVAEIAHMIADTTGGNIVIDNFTLSGCKYVGDIPDLGPGLLYVPLTVEATGLTVVTS
ncbi:MAG TPA: phage tail tube protein [Candidatus Krumholzibacteria bacterium]|nr:phage tail tube protein [Candidatus Krumholzibacteria bacterium]HPD73515.1 phage tail tube protein [Candidatus Krumholzibacteria bacterium]HRY42237.1 phage tail tube protein [Candidatus Krumholzibacteria bacterium]